MRLVMLQISSTEDSIDAIIAALNLEPLQEPEPVRFTFETIGWLMLLGFTIGVITVLVMHRVKVRRHNRYRREALQELAKLESGLPGLIGSLAVLKRTAIIAFGREEVAQLDGKEWIRFVDMSATGVDLMQYNTAIDFAVYRGEYPDANEDRAIRSNIEKWIKTHAS